MKYHAFKEANGDVKEFMASTPEKLRGFIEAYWLNRNIPEDTWRQMRDHGYAIHFPQDGTIHIEIED